MLRLAADREQQTTDMWMPAPYSSFAARTPPTILASGACSGAAAVGPGGIRRLAFAYRAALGIAEPVQRSAIGVTGGIEAAKAGNGPRFGVPVGASGFRQRCATLAARAVAA